MKYRVFCISALAIILLFPGKALPQESRDEKFKKGTEYFSSGNYKEALNLWTGIYNAGYRSGELNYNIGNAYFKLNNIPGAILFYERAYLLKPADEDITYNLNIARTLVVDRFEEIPELFFIKWYNIVSLILSANSWAKVSLITFVLCLLFLSLYFYSSVYRYKVIGFWVAVLVLLVSVTSLALAARNKSLVHDSHKAIIYTPSVNGKSSPDSSGTDLFILHEGTKVAIEDEVGNWYEIRLSDGNKGWIPANTIEII
jgi:tetratricopeptide (TPR) repeat protein